MVARITSSGELQLVAYVVSEKLEPVPSARDLWKYMQQKLPSYMIPSHFIFLDSLPLTPNGKADRRHLPLPEIQSDGMENMPYMTCSPIEEGLIEIWRGVLGQIHLGAHDNFFELGGHSLLATQVISRIREMFLVELPLRSLFEAPTIAGLAQCIEHSLREEQGIELSPLLPVPRDAALPLSFAQQRLWFLDQLDPGSAAYNIPFALRLRGTLLVYAVERSLHEIVQRHENLRTSFLLRDEQPVQFIETLSHFSLRQTDMSSLLAQEQEIATRKLIAEEANLPFDLGRGPLLRGTLLRIQDDEHVLLLTMHHIISDGWSSGILMRELSALYTAFVNKQSSPLPALPIQYADFALWQRHWLQGEVLERQVQYWREHLAAVPP